MKPFAILTFACLSVSMMTFAGDITRRYELTRDRVLQGGPPHYSIDFVIADAIPRHERRFTEFSGDVSGRFLEAVSTVIMFEGKDARRGEMAMLKSLVDQLLPLQKPDGHFGDAFSTGTIQNSDMALLWGNGRLLVGLLAYHRLDPRPDVLEAATRLGDCFLALAPRIDAEDVEKEFSDSRVAVGYICWTQTIEGLAELARVTGKQKYIDLCERIAKRTHYYPSQHSHGFVTTLRGILDFYALTRDRKYLEQVEREWEGIVSTGNLLPHGALPEAFEPKIERDEGCSEADWLRLNLELWKHTENRKYLEAAEHCLFNEFYHNQYQSGDFGHRVICQAGTTPPSARAWWCCTLHGLRAFPEVITSAFRQTTGSLCYDIPIDSSYTNTDISLRAESSLEETGTVRLAIHAASDKEQSILIRSPQWCSNVTVTIGGQITGEVDGEYLVLKKRWSAGEAIELKYAFRTEVRQHEKQKMLLCGPWILGADDDASPRYFDEPRSRNRVDVSDLGEDISHEASVKSDSLRTSFPIPVARRQVKLFPGGYSMQPQSVLLRPIAEHTGSDDRTSWVFLFPR